MNTINVDFSDTQTTYVEVEETVPRQPANRRESAWIGSGGFRSISQAKGCAEKQVPRVRQQQREGRDQCV